MNRKRIFITYILILSTTAGAWLWALGVFSGYPLLLGSAFLAYTLGLRHAVDADHIAAIDMVTRKLIQEGKQPVHVGFFFGLGHSAVVLLASAAVALGAGAFKDKLAAAAAIGGLAGASISIGFLLLMGIVNIVIFTQIYKTFRRVRDTGVYSQEEMDAMLQNRGVFSGIFRRLFGVITQSRQMFLIGGLFGLSFDTATEIAVLGIAAAGALKGIGIWSIMVFPILFMCGMTLLDTTDGLLMQKVYGWAFLMPVRKLYYNLTITGASIAGAVIVAGIEISSLWGKNCNSSMLGIVLIGVFICAWLVSLLIYRCMRYEDLFMNQELLMNKGLSMNEGLLMNDRILTKN